MSSQPSLIADLSKVESTSERTQRFAKERKMLRHKLTPEELTVIRLAVSKMKFRDLTTIQNDLIKKMGKGDFFMVLYTPKGK